jgi:hypothetical protein
MLSIRFNGDKACGGGDWTAPARLNAPAVRPIVTAVTMIMRHLPFLLPVLRLATGCIVVLAEASAAEPRVDLEVISEPGFIVTDARAWSEMLSQAGFSSVRIKSGTPDSPSLQTSGTASSPAYRVVGILTSENQLVLPKGRFKLADRGQIEAWVRKLRDGGEEGVFIKPAAFGLLPKQLVEVHEALAVSVKSSTVGQTPRDAAKQIADRLSLKFISDEGSQRALAAGEPVADELQGLSSGTALAALLRPLGLVMFPEKNGAEIRLRITSSKSAKEHWPVGWPPKGNPSETLPDLFKFLNVEIEKTPLSEVLTAISGRVKAPLLLDHNALAREEIDMNSKVSLPKTNTYYARALDRMLFQAKLKQELRVDEANKPFLWITTLKQ